MDESESFRRELLATMKERGYSEAQLSVMAGLNKRAVTDIREQRVASPKLSTVFALAKALDRDPAEMMGLGRRYKLRQDLAEYLSRLEEEEQGRFLAAVRLLPRTPA